MRGSGLGVVRWIETLFKISSKSLFLPVPSLFFWNVLLDLPVNKNVSSQQELTFVGGTEMPGLVDCYRFLLVSLWQLERPWKSVLWNNPSGYLNDFVGMLGQILCSWKDWLPSYSGELGWAFLLSVEWSISVAHLSPREYPVHDGKDEQDLERFLAWTLLKQSLFVSI